MKSHEIKDILEERTIEVSENSWDKLASQLYANDQKEKRKTFYLPYAACLALLFGVIAFMFVKNEGNKTSETIVDTNSKEIIKQAHLKGFDQLPVHNLEEVSEGYANQVIQDLRRESNIVLIGDENDLPPEGTIVSLMTMSHVENSAHMVHHPFNITRQEGEWSFKKERIIIMASPIAWCHPQTSLFKYIRTKEAIEQAIRKAKNISTQ